MDLVQKQQKLLDRFTRAKMGQIMPLLPEDESRVAEDLERAVQTQDAVVSVIKSLSDHHGHLSEVLERVLKLTEAA